MIKNGMCGKLKYLLFIPSSSTGLPLVVVLHGSGEAGSSLVKLKKREPYISLNSGKCSPNAIVLMPQLPNGSWGKMASELKDLIDTVAETYKCDQSRISITGHSLGGMGVFQLLRKYPNYFSAGAALSCAKNYKGELSKLAHIPIWFLCGEKEKVYGKYAREMYTVMNTLNEESRLTVIKGYGHPIQFAWCNSRYGIFEWLTHYKLGDLNNPNWMEWLNNQGVMNGNKVTEKISDPLPEEMVKRLGIRKCIRI